MSTLPLRYVKLQKQFRLVAAKVVFAVEGQVVGHSKHLPHGFHATSELFECIFFVLSAMIHVVLLIQCICLSCFLKLEQMMFVFHELLNAKLAKRWRIRNAFKVEMQ